MATAVRSASIVKIVEAIPTKQYTVMRHAAAKAGAGVGEALVAPEVHKAWPLEMARLTHPIHVKSTVFISRPIQYRGGQLMELWKKKGSRSLMSSQRDVTLCDEDSKVLGGHNRSSVMPVVRSIVSPTAMGSGLNDGACDTAHLLVTKILAHAIKTNVCGYVIFADVKTAFAALYRNLAMMNEDDGD